MYECLFLYHSVILTSVFLTMADQIRDSYSEMLITSCSVFSIRGVSGFC